MSAFEPGPGWREWAPGTPLADDQDVLTLDTADGKRSWVRDEPVPPLPTEPGTVIEVMSTTAQELDVTPWFFTPNQEWAPIGEYAASLQDGLRLAHITSFRIVSRPVEHHDIEGQQMIVDAVRRETAKAVLDRVRAVSMWAIPAQEVDPTLDAIASDFGVSDAS